MTRNRKKVAVLFGGRSSEYSVSLQSAHSVITHMDKNKYEPIPVGITEDGNWYLYTGDVDRIPEDRWYGDKNCVPVTVSLHGRPAALLLLKDTGAEKFPVDVVFPVLHGKNGEDGTVQGLLELAGIPVAGCGVLASALCMDKDRAHKLARAAGVPVPDAFVLTNPADARLERADALGYPLFVKPVRAGSSYGITKVMERGQFMDAIRLAFEYDSQVIVEECIPGFEVGCAVLGNDVLTVGEPDEIELSDGFFDFTEKYTLKTSAIHVPARITPEQNAKFKELAQAVYRALGCQGFARVDFFLEPGGRIVFNEVNTIPGFTSHSRYPNMMKAAGVPFEEVISRVIELAAGQR